MFAIQFSNQRRVGGKLKCGMIDVGPRLADDLEKFGYKSEAVTGNLKKRPNIDGDLDLVFCEHHEI